MSKEDSTLAVLLKTEDQIEQVRTVAELLKGVINVSITFQPAHGVQIGVTSSRQQEITAEKLYEILDKARASIAAQEREAYAQRYAQEYVKHLEQAAKQEGEK